MRHGRIYRRKDHRLLLPNVMLATGAWERLRGLLGRAPPGDDEGMLIDPCASVHTLGMRYPIDLVFLSPQWRVTRVFDRLPPLRMAWSWRARRVLELRAGMAAQLPISAGDELVWEAVE